MNRKLKERRFANADCRSAISNRRSLRFIHFTFGKKTSADIPARNLSSLFSQADLHAEDLPDPVFDCLHIARREFGLAIDLLDGAGEILSRETNRRGREPARPP